MTALSKWCQYLMGVLENFEIWTDNQKESSIFQKTTKVEQETSTLDGRISRIPLKLAS